MAEKARKSKGKTNAKQEETEGGAAAEAIRSGEATPHAGPTEGAITGGVPTEETVRGKGRKGKRPPREFPEPSEVQEETGSTVRRGG